MELRKNLYGEAECNCKDEYLRLYNSTGNLNCYQEYLQGPCKNGQQLIKLVSNTTEYKNTAGTCVPTNCDINQIQYNNTCIGLCISITKW